MPISFKKKFFKDETILVQPSYYKIGCSVGVEYVKIETVDELKRNDLTDKIAAIITVVEKDKTILEDDDFGTIPNVCVSKMKARYYLKKWKNKTDDQRSERRLSWR